MDGSIVASLLATDKDRDEVTKEIATAQQMGVSGVPCFIIDNKYAVMGAQQPEAIVDAVRQAAQQTDA
jgi:predicted DsbA family dithiol-disulfide isomerase